LRAEDALDIRTEMLAVQLFDALDRPLEADRAAARADRAADGYRLASHWEELHPIRVRYGALARLGRVEQLVQGQQAPAAAAEFQHLIETLELDTMEPMLVTGAKVALMSSEFDQARTYLDLFATRMDDTPLVRHLRGQLEGAAGNLEPAAAQLAAAAATQPSAESYQILTQLLEQLGRHDEAYEANSAALSERAIEAYAGNNLDAALQDFDQAIRRQTVAPRTWYYLGLTLEAKGELPLARQALNDCLKADPQHGPAKRALQRLAGK
jgi:tetratricopeptide (TPR) repeat protein